MTRALGLAALLAAGLAAADGQQWSVVGPRTVAPGGNALELGAGWPGLSVGYLRGIASGLNLGARLSFDYGLEGLVRTAIPGFKVQATVKARLVDAERLSLGLVFEPGPLFHFPSASSSRIGFALPVGLRFGIATSSALTLAVRLDAPMWVEFGPAGGFNLPILTGLGLEYFATSAIAIFARVQVGPTIRPSGLAEFTLDAALGVGFHL